MCTRWSGNSKMIFFFFTRLYTSPRGSRCHRSLSLFFCCVGFWLHYLSLSFSSHCAASDVNASDFVCVTDSQSRSTNSLSALSAPTSTHHLQLKRIFFIVKHEEVFFLNLNRLKLVNEKYKKKSRNATEKADHHLRIQYPDLFFFCHHYLQVHRTQSTHFVVINLHFSLPYLKSPEKNENLSDGRCCRPSGPILRCLVNL